MKRQLLVACAKDDVELMRIILQGQGQLSSGEFNEILMNIVSRGNLEMLTCMIDTLKPDLRIVNRTSLLEMSLALKHFDVSNYLVALPGLGENDLNLLLRMLLRSVEPDKSLRSMAIEQFALLSRSRQNELWLTVNVANFEGVKEIVEAGDYYDLEPAISCAAIQNRMEILEYLFGKASTTLRVEQINRILAASGAEAKGWLEKQLLQQRLTNILGEKGEGTKLKI